MVVLFEFFLQNSDMGFGHEAETIVKVDLLIEFEILVILLNDRGSDLPDLVQDRLLVHQHDDLPLEDFGTDVSRQVVTGEVGKWIVETE